MFSFLSAKPIEKEIALPFKAVLELRDDGYFLARIPDLPGCTARGRTKSDALRNVAEAARLHVDRAGAGDFEVVWADPGHPTLNTLHAYFGRLVAGSSRDGALCSASGDLGAWDLGPLSRAGYQPQGGFILEGGGEAGAELVDFTPQVYCLASFAGAGVPRLYAGSGHHGGIYESVDGRNWELSTATGEARVHCLATFKDRLYAGSSGSGKLFCFTGTHWSLVHRCPESAITAAAEFKGELFFGTYPSGQIFASADGVNWHLAYDSGQTFVRAFCVFDGALYAATSRAGGGVVLRSADGLRWEKAFESKDPNFYCLKSFHQALWLGTGNNGRLYRSRDGGNWQLAASLEDEGIRAMEAFEGRLYLATEGAGRIYRSRFADNPPPQILDVAVTDVSSHSAAVRWRTDRPADAEARWGLGEALTDSARSSAVGLEHKLALSYLRALTTYRLRLISRCPDGSEAGFTADLSFTTAAAETASVSSSSHPDPERWHARQDAQLSWNAPEGIVRFHYCLDRNPDSLPLPGAAGVASTAERSAAFAGLEDGVWWFHLLCEDRAGNLGGAATHFRLRIDTQALPPRLASPSHPIDGGWSNRAKAQFAWEPPADLSGIAGYLLLLDRRPGSVPGKGSGQQLAEPRFSVELPEDGEWWLHAVSVDEAGNVGREASHYCIRLDRRADPPQLSSPSHPDPERWVNSSNPVFHWSPAPDASGITGYYHLLDQRPETVPTAHTGAFTLSTSASFQSKPDGVWYFHIVAADAAGNVGTEAAHLRVRIDTWAAPPALSSPTHPQGSWVSSPRVVFELEPPDDLSGIVGYYTLLDRERSSVPVPDKAAYSAERSLEFTGLSDGLWTLHAVSKDAAGNVGVEAAHCTVRIDTEARPPLLSSVSHPAQDEWYRAAAVDMAWDPPEDHSGVANYYYLLDQDPETVPTAHSGLRTTENRARVEAKEDGVWYFHIVTQDRAGNVGRSAAHYKLRIDTKALPPRLHCPTHPDRAAWSSHTRPRFEWFEPEDSSGVVGYYWCIDRNPDSLPSPASAAYTTERYAVADRGLEGDGVWWFHVVSRDRAGNVGVEASHYPILIDTTAAPPLISSPTHPDRHAWSNSPSPVFQWEAPEDHSGIAGYYTLLNHSQTSIPNEATGTWTEEPRAAFSGLEDGVWTLHVVSKDRCGNVGTQAAHYSVRIDTQAEPPVVASPTHPEGAWTRQASPTFTWTPPRDASGVAGYYHCLDREPSTVPTREKGAFTTGTLAAFPRLDDGVWIFHIVSADSAGNVGTRAAHYSIHIDTAASAPKVASSTHPDPDKWTKASVALFSWAAPEDPSGVSGYYWCVDQSPETVPGPQSQWTTETQASSGERPDGEWWFHVATKDGAGNLSQEASHFRFRIDTKAPEPRVHSKTHPDPEQWSCQSKPSFVWEDGDDLSGIAGHYWAFDHSASTPLMPNASNWTTASSVTLPPQKDGIWYFHLAAKDKAGNLSPPTHLMVRIETQAPVSRLEGLPALSGQAAFEVRWKGEDRVSGVSHFDVQVREGEGGAWRNWLAESAASSALFTGRDGVSYQFRVRATDKAGNAEAFNESGPYPTVAVDLSPPEPVNKLSAKAGPEGSVRLSWSEAQDHSSGVAHYEVYRSALSGELGALISPPEGVPRCSFVDPGKGLEDGALYYYTVCPVDKAGNRRLEGNERASCLCDRAAAAPLLASPSHPSPLDWYRQVTARVVWEHPPDASGIAGYYWALNQTLAHHPDPRSASFTEVPELALEGLKDGTWYLHVATKDLAGNLSAEAAHYQFNIDTLPPPAPGVKSPTHPNPEAWNGSGDASFAWSTPPDASGIAGYHWLLDDKPHTVPGPSNGQFTTASSASVEGLGDGVWYFHVAAKDRAGNCGSEAGHCRIQVARSAPPPQLSSPTHPRPGESSSSRSAVFLWSTPAFSQPIVAWHYCLDQEAATVPGPKDPRTSEQRLEFNDLADGDWTLHVVSVEASGKVGRLASHYPLRVRSTGSISGVATKPNGILPLEGAGLELYRQGRSVAKAQSNKEGRFRFDELELGDYVLKLDAPPHAGSGQALPPMLLEGLRLDAGQLSLNVSSEVCAWPHPTRGSKEARLLVLAKEPGALAVKIYTENGQVVGQLEAPAPRPGYVKLAWNCSGAAAGVYLWQATLSGAAGKITKYPIRKLQVSGA